MKRKILNDDECMSGSGWHQDSFEIECPTCWTFNTIKDNKFKCKECGNTFKIERGCQLLMRAVEKEK